MIIEEEVYLEHWGVKGMKWGILNEKNRKAYTQARREKGAQKYEDRAAGLQTRIAKVDSYISKSNYYHKRELVAIRADLASQRVTALSDAKAKREGKLSSEQKKVLKGAAVAGVIIAAIATKNMAESGELHRKALQGKDFLQGKDVHTWKQNASLSKPDMDVDAIMSNVVTKINPGFGEYGTKMNCRRATFAYEMRRRGMDVRATRTSNARGQTAVGLDDAISPGKKEGPVGVIAVVSKQAKEAIDKSKGKRQDTPFAEMLDKNVWGRNIILDSKKTPDMMSDKVAPAIFKSLSKQPNGARGELGVGWNFGGGHSMAWEIVKGKPVIFDGQTGKKYMSSEIFNTEFGGTIKDVGFTRLDNIPLNDKFLLKWVKDVD